MSDQVGNQNVGFLMTRLIFSSLQEARDRPEGASVPALGLSNKAIFPEGPPPDLSEDLVIKPGSNEQYADNVYTSVILKGKTLWGRSSSVSRVSALQAAVLRSILMSSTFFHGKKITLFHRFKRS